MPSALMSVSQGTNIQPLSGSLPDQTDSKSSLITATAAEAIQVQRPTKAKSATETKQRDCGSLKGYLPLVKDIGITTIALGSSVWMGTSTPYFKTALTLIAATGLFVGQKLHGAYKSYHQPVPTKEEIQSGKWLERGCAHYNKGEFNEALEALETAMRLDCGNPTTLVRRAQVKLQLAIEQKHVDEKGYNELLQSANLDVDDFLTLYEHHGDLRSDILTVLGNIHFELERYSRAHNCFKIALKYNPENFKAAVGLANANLEMRLFDDAIEESKIAIQLHQARKQHGSTRVDQNLLALAYQVQGDIYECRQDHAKALECYQTALTFNPSNLNLVTCIAFNKALLGKEFSPHENSPSYLEGQILADSSRGIKTEISEELVTTSNDPYLKGEYHQNIGGSFLRSEEYQKALDAFDQSIQLWPKSLFAVAGRAKAHKFLGNREAALADAQTVLMNFQKWPYFHEESSVPDMLEMIAELNPEKSIAALDLAQKIRNGKYREQFVTRTIRHQWMTQFFS